MNINSKIINTGQDIWFDPTFKSVLEDHMSYLRNHPNTQVKLLEPNLVIKYRFDLYSLLNECNIEPKYHWLLMRMNKINSPIDDFRLLEFIIIPDLTIVTRILSHFNSRNRKRGN